MTEKLSLTVTKFIRADRNKVFAAWITPESMNQWFSPKGMTIKESSADPRIGGRFHAVIEGDQGSHTVRCVYREIVPGQKLVFSQRWDEPEAVETLVTVLFADHDGGTQLTLMHENFRNQESRDAHIPGWTSTLENLASTVT